MLDKKIIKIDYETDYVIFEDSVGGVYMDKTGDLKGIVKDYFGLDDFYLVDNNASMYFREYDKVKEISHTTYSYIVA